MTIAPTVTLETLLAFCWQQGIVVAHLGRLPKVDGFRKFDGLVLFAEERPCIFLAEKQDAPAWLAFHLAHELGHLLLRHVTPGSELLADDDIDKVVTDQVEDEADAFASELLTGDPHPNLPVRYGMTGEKLAIAAQHYGARHGIDPASVALVYGHNNARMGAAMTALDAMNQRVGARALIHKSLLGHLRLDQVSESEARFVEQLVFRSNDAMQPQG